MAPNNSENREPTGHMTGMDADIQSKSRLFAE